MNEFTTPMMKQYERIKKQYQDCLLFYRMGDFYELFLEDAQIGAKVLNITLTSRAKGKDGRIPMSGVPYHAVDTYLTKLVKAGYKVAICEQISLPNKHGIIDREVVRIVTPGTILDEKSLEKKDNNYIISLVIENNIIGISAADISTGYFATTEFVYDDLDKTLLDEISRLKPSECILSNDLYNDGSLLKILRVEKNINIFPWNDADLYTEDAKQYLQKHFNVKSLESFGIEDKVISCKAAAVLLAYLKDTQKGTVSHIKKIASLHVRDGLLLDRSSMINLELFSTIREHDTKGSLLTTLDNTITAMGGRLLKQWLRKPLGEKKQIDRRLESVEVFTENATFRDTIREQLKHIPDIERLLSRLSVNLGNGRDLVNLQTALESILLVKSHLITIASHNPTKTTGEIFMQHQIDLISHDLQDIVDYIKTYIVDEPPIALKEGGIIKNGINHELDTLRNTIIQSKTWLTEFENIEKERTKINSLKVRFNKVFGFYIEVSKANLHLIPNNYSRKQTLVNGERFITKELKKHEEIILTAEEKINEIEYIIFLQVLSYVLSHVEIIQNAAQSIAYIDCLTNFAYIAEKNNYVKPKMLYSGEIKIKGGRHPVVEKLIENSQFVPNDLTLDNTNQQLLLITGPNMAGKSVYLRQTALIVLMSHMGCFVPAQSAYISIVDRIFVRSGASDVITSGLSTFMVEMVETAYILNNATKHSLIIMDEIGRGTSTYDGISIAWAVAEYLITHISPSPKTLFATHYHELQSLENEYPKNIKNFHMSVTEEKGEPIFLFTIRPGGAPHSFGVAVAKLAGVPNPVIEKANEILQTLEWRDVEKGKQYFDNKQDTTTEIIADHLLHTELANLDVANMTPLEALNKLADIKEKLKLLTKKADSVHAD